MIRPFERLTVWQKSRQLIKLIYALISKFPHEERFGLSDQLRRAVISVASNLAEGSGRISYKEKIHFCEIAYGSLMEVSCQLFIAYDLAYISLEELEDVQAFINELDMQLCAFRRSLITKSNDSK